MLVKKYRLKKTREYNQVYKYGKKFPTRYTVIFIVKNNQLTNRFGFIASKKVGKAVTRNKIKRRLRAVVQKNWRKFDTGYDFIVIAKRSAQNASVEQLEKDFLKAMQRAGVC